LHRVKGEIKAARGVFENKKCNISKWNASGSYKGE
jgi:hypothetical protein